MRQVEYNGVYGEDRVNGKIAMKKELNVENKVYGGKEIQLIYQQEKLA